MFGLLHSLFSAGVAIGSDIKASHNEDLSRQNAIAKGDIVYYDRNHQLRLIENGHLCAEFFKDENCPFECFDLDNPYSDYNIIDYKTHQHYYITREIAQSKLIQKVKKAKANQDSTLLYLFKVKSKSIKTNQQELFFRQHTKLNKAVDFTDGLSGELYINPLEVDLLTINFAHPMETVKNNHIYMARNVDIITSIEGKSFQACYYMDSRTGLLTDPTPEQLIFEQYLKNKNDQYQITNYENNKYQHSYYKWFTESELYANMLLFNELQIKRLNIIIEKIKNDSNKLNQSELNCLQSDMLKIYMFAQMSGALYYGIEQLDCKNTLKATTVNYAKDYVKNNFVLDKGVTNSIKDRFVRLVGGVAL